MTPDRDERLLVATLRIGAFLCLAGWTWGHLYWEGPYGALLWGTDSHSLAGRLGLDWDNYVGTGANDGFVQRWIRLIGWLYLAGAVLALTVRKTSRVQMAALVGSSLLLVFLSYAKYVSAQRQLPMFVEHGGQMLSPILLILALWLGPWHRVTVITAIVAFLTTFAGHGAYAIGWWPTPATFFAMTTVILGVEHDTALLFLRIAGVLDFVICIGIFIPVLRIPSVIYAVVWGLLTALARPVSGMSTDLNFWGADQYLHEAILRAPHYLVPLYLYFLWRKPRITEPEAPPSETLPDISSPDQAGESA